MVTFFQLNFSFFSDCHMSIFQAHTIMNHIFLPSLHAYCRGGKGIKIEKKAIVHNFTDVYCHVCISAWLIPTGKKIFFILKI